MKAGMAAVGEVAEVGDLDGGEAGLHQPHLDVGCDADQRGRAQDKNLLADAILVTFARDL